MTYRDRTLRDLADVPEGQAVRLAGWVASVRDHGGMVFLVLRDRWGRVQAVVRPGNEELQRRAGRLRPESVVSVRGTVQPRPEGLVNPDMETGAIEVDISELTVLSAAEPLPFVLAEGDDVAPRTRMQYRYLDMRRPAVRDALLFRHRTARAVRAFLSDRDFVEIETPVLTRSTPEGARDYLVPSRVHRRTCYALPQSPQLFKQLLMTAGFDRYFQMARCFRDEDQRADRQPEFTQVDVEMSFVNEEDVMGLAEEMTLSLFSELLGHEPPRPLPRMTYAEALAAYGTDKPDLRFGMALHDLTGLAAGCGFRVFADQAEKGGRVLGFSAPGAGAFSRRQIKELEAAGKEAGLGGLVTFQVRPGGLHGPTAKFFDAPTLEALGRALDAGPGSLLVLAAGPHEATARGLGEVRLRLGRDLGLADPGAFSLLWVVEPPLFAWNADEERLDPVHHPFTMPREEDLPLLETDPARVRAQAYDLVLNGHEIAGGSVRIHRSGLQRRIFELIGLGEEEAREKFGFLLEAFRYGPPPHGGIAYGFDRLVALLQGLDNIRDVIPFPKTTRAFCPLTGAPGPVDDAQLGEVGLAWAAPGPAEEP